MEKDKWKSFLDENRDAFEHDRPSERVWGNIRAQLPEAAPAMVKLSTVLKVAAVAVLVVSISFWVLLDRKSESVAKQVGHDSENLSSSGLVLAQLSPEYREMEVFYVSRIQSAMSEVKDLPEDEELLRSLRELDTEFGNLREEMKENVNEAEIIEAMIMTYKMKLDLLERYLDSWKEIEDDKN